MFDRPASEERITLFRLIAFWTVLLSALLTAGSDFSLSGAPGRFLYWAAHIGLGLILVSLVTQWLQMIGLSRFSEWTQLALSSIVAVIVFAPVGIILDLVIPSSFGPDGHGDIDSDVEAQGTFAATIDEISAYAPTVIVVWLIVHLSYRFLSGPTRTESTNSNTTVATDQNDPDTDKPTLVSSERILQKIPPALGHDIVVIRSDANYIHVETLLGKTMFLYSLARAADELDDLGFLVHRSYWIGFEHVQAVKRESERMVCLMTNGTSVPVSRRRQKAVTSRFGKNFVRADGAAQVLNSFGTNQRAADENH